MQPKAVFNEEGGWAVGFDAVQVGAEFTYSTVVDLTAKAYYQAGMREDYESGVLFGVSILRILIFD
jgi:hypothetical protein